MSTKLRQTVYNIYPSNSIESLTERELSRRRVARLTEDTVAEALRIFHSGFSSTLSDAGEAPSLHSNSAVSQRDSDEHRCAVGDV